MKFWFSYCKYVCEIAGPACYGPYGYYTPYTVWRRVGIIPFMYRYFGQINRTRDSTQKDFDDWVEFKEARKCRN